VSFTIINVLTLRAEKRFGMEEDDVQPDGLCAHAPDVSAVAVAASGKDISDSMYVSASASHEPS
jgi:hypothetical protein